jgi:pimeloyl-ACP methyl ester carboxylesterase
MRPVFIPAAPTAALQMSDAAAWPDLPLPAGVRSRRVPGLNGMDLHLLEAGDPAAPCLLLLHGFPELAYSWRHQLRPLAEAGYHVLAPDQRGYGRTTGWPADYDADLRPFGLMNLARDALGLLAATGHREAAAVIGHDFGSLVAAWCALLRPDVFRRLVMMSAPFGGPPPLPGWGGPAAPADLAATLAALPRPRKHYQLHYGTREANAEMRQCPQGVHDFLRAYYHVKSADWPGNRPQPLPDWRAETLARMPTYYIMDLDQGMAETVAKHRPTPAQVAAYGWLPEADLAVYAAEYRRTGFQGGLQWYRCSTHPPCVAELQACAGRTIDVPACFIAGASDWGRFQKPGELQRMRSACSRLLGVQVVPGAGHWVQQEQPAATLRLLHEFLAMAA